VRMNRYNPPQKWKMIGLKDDNVTIRSNVIYDDKLNRPLTTGHEFYIVEIVRGLNSETLHYESYASVIEKLSMGGMDSATIRRFP
jgi:hypothetical protein